MSQQFLIGSLEKTEQQIAYDESRPDSARSFQGALHPIPQLQRTLGNRNVAKLVQAKQLTPGGKIIGLQRKLIVGAADDQYEQEADRIARQVLSMPDAVATSSIRRVLSPEEEEKEQLPLQTKPLAASIAPLMQKQMVKEEAEDKDKPVQAKFSSDSFSPGMQCQAVGEEEDELVQAKQAEPHAGSFAAGEEIETQLSLSKGRGSALPDTVRAFMEPRFGVDLRQVRVHMGNEAVQMNEAVGAQAFTHGRDIYFGAGHSPTNLELTAHELTHVVQQGGGVPLQAKRLNGPPPVNSALSLQRACAACAAGGSLCPGCATEDSPIQRKFDPTSITRAFATKRRPKTSQMLMHRSGSGSKPAISPLSVNGAGPFSIQRDEEPSVWDQATSAIGGAASAVADAVLPEGLLDKARSAVDAAQEKAGAVAGLGDEAANNATSESQSVESQVQSNSESAIDPNRQQGAVAAVESQTQADQIRGEVQSQMGTAAAAASSVSRVGAMMDSLLNPAAPVLDFSGLAAPRAGRPDATAPVPEEIANLGRDIGQGIQQGLAEGGTPGWDCDAAEIVAMAGNVTTALTKSAVSVGKRVLGEDRFNALVQFGEETIAKLQAAANQAKKLVQDAKESALAWWEENVTPYINKVEEVAQAVGQKYEELKQTVSEGVHLALEWGAQQWERIKTNVVDVVSQGIDRAKQFVEEKVNWVRDLVSRFWNLLPDWLKTAITGAAAVLAGPAALALAAAQKAAAYISDHKDQILGQIRAAADAVVQGFAEQYAAVREVLSDAGSTVKGWMNDAGQAIREGANQVYASIDEATGGRLSAVRQAVADFGQEVKGEACAVLGETVGPCVEQFVPDPGEGGKGFGELTASGELSVVIEGVPVKVGAGAKVNITREGQKYTVVISGEGTLGVSLKAEEGGGGGGGGSSGSVSLDVDLPAGGKWKAWEKLTGKSPPASPNTGAPPTTNVPRGPTTPVAPPANASRSQPSPNTQGQGPGTAPGGPSGPSAEIGAGIKGSVEMTYEFDASKDKTSCDGLGGMTALLASQGLAASLPMPFGNLAGQLGQAAFADRLTSCKFSAAEYADISIDLAKGDIGSLKFKLSGERGVEIETSRDLQTGEVTEKATLKTELSGSLAGQLAAAGPMSGLGGSVGLKGSLSVTLAYSPARDVISALELEAKMSASLALTNWSQIRSALPANIAATVDAGLQPTLAAGTSGELSVEASFKIKNLQELASQLDAYFSNPEQVSAGGLWTKVSGFLENPQNREQGFKIELTETAGMGGVTLGGEASSQGTGGSVSVGIRRGVTRKKILYSSQP